MNEPRPYTARELLAWSRFAALTLFGVAMDYARERAGSTEALIAFAQARLAETWSGLNPGSVEGAMLSLLLNAEALGAEVRSRAMNPEEAEAIVTNLPGEQVSRDLEHEFDVAITPEEILSMAGVSQEELNQLYDVFGAVAAASGLEYRREPEGADAQRIVLRAW